MQWERKDKYYEQSPGGYVVCAVRVQDRWLFEAWTPPPRTMIKISAVAAEAKKACEQHSSTKARGNARPS